MSDAGMWSVGSAAMVWLVGTLVGIGWVWWHRQSQSKSIPLAPAVSFERLEEQQAALELALVQVQELQRQQALLPQAVYQIEKQRAEQRAVVLLAQQQNMQRALAQEPATLAAPSSAGIRFLRDRPRLQGALWGMLFTGAVCAWVIFLQTESRKQPAGQPAASSPNPLQGEVQALLARLEQAPEDTAALARLNQLLLRQQMFQEAAVVNERLLSIDPNHAQGQVFAAVLQAAKGQAEAGRARLRQLCEQHPNLPDAWFFRGMLAMQAGEQGEVRLAFGKYVEVAPQGPQRDRIAAMLKQMVQGESSPGLESKSPQPSNPTQPANPPPSQ